MQKFVVIILLLSITTGTVYSQQSKEPDSLKVYRKIQKFAGKRKLTKWMYRNIFNVPEENKTRSVKKTEKAKKQIGIEAYNGKIIRKIKIYTYDPFGFSLEDTTQRPKAFFQKVGNAIHSRTATRIIRDQLLVKEGDTLDVLKIKESARILRTLAYIRDAQVKILPLGAKNDSVDVGFFVSDVWTISGGIAVSENLLKAEYTDKSFGGLGHQMYNQFKVYRDRGYSSLRGYYRIPTLGKTFISATGYYNTDPYDFIRGIVFDRPFYSPLAKWAGGIDLLDIRSGVYSIKDENHYASTTRYMNYDFWAGRGYSIDNDTTEEIRTTKVILAGRYQHINVLDFRDDDGSVQSPDNLTVDTYLGSVAISARTYYRDYYIYRYGIQEDVPVGRLIRLDGGVERRGNNSRPYLGGEYRTGNHFDNFGYAYTGFSLGSFLNSGKLQQSVFKIGIGYFSDLLKLKDVRFRQFVKVNITYGFHRLPGERIYLNASNGVSGFNSDQLIGIKKAVISLQSQFYLPYNFIGFRFAPFLFASFGQIAMADQTFLNSRFYQTYGLGILIKNELLVISTFQFSIGWTPSFPGQDSNLRFNPIRSYNFTFDDFAVTKPTVVVYD